MIQSSKRLRDQILGSYPILLSLASGDADREHVVSCEGPLCKVSIRHSRLGL